MVKKGCLLVDNTNLSWALVFGKGDQCLDTTTGDIVPRGQCPAEDVGEGRPGIGRGKRYISVPVLDEIWQERKAAHEERARLDPSILEFQDEELDELAFKILTGDAIAMDWLASLRPPFAIAWRWESLSEPRIYRPESGRWELCDA